MVKVVKYNAIVTILHPQKFFFSYFPSFACLHFTLLDTDLSLAADHGPWNCR